MISIGNYENSRLGECKLKHVKSFQKLSILVFKFLIKKIHKGRHRLKNQEKLIYFEPLPYLEIFRSKYFLLKVTGPSKKLGT